MRNYLAVMAKRGRSADLRHAALVMTELQRSMSNLARFTLPCPTSMSRWEEWWAPNRDVAMLAFTNEAPSQGNLIVGDEAIAVGRVGYLAGGVADIDFTETTSQSTLARRTGGCFAIIRCDANGITATTDATRSCGLFVAETADLKIVGSRALLAALGRHVALGGTLDQRPEHDLVSMRSMAALGHFLGDQTPYEGVRAAREATTVRLDPWYTREENDSVEAEVAANPQDSEWTAVVSRASDLLMHALEPIRGEETTLSLTGGRDSRLLAAAMSASDITRFRTATTGVQGHPDVDLALRIAVALGFVHDVHEPPAPDTNHVWAEEPLARIHRNLDVHDAMTSAWDDIGTYGPMSARVNVSGVGGEVLRGGLVLPDVDRIDGPLAASRIRSTMLPNPRYFAPDLMDAATAFAQPWIEASRIDPFAALDDYYFVHRNGRWISARRSGVRFRTMAVDPLLDNRLMRQVRRVKAASRWSERLVYDMIAVMAPQIADLPLEGTRWRFERSGPMPGASRREVETWSSRVALKPPDRVAPYSLQRLADPSLRAKLRELVAERLEGPASALYNGRQVLEIFDQGVPRYPTFLWHTATASVMLSDDWWLTDRPDKRLTVSVPLPG